MPDIIKFLDDFKDEALIPALSIIKETASRYKEGVLHPIETIKRGANIINENVVIPATEYVSKVDDIAEGRITGDQGQPLLVEDLPITQQAAGGIFHVFNQVGQGVIGTGEGMLRGMEWLGVDSVKPLGDKLQSWQEIAAVENPTFADNLAKGLGSAATFYIPGIGVAKGAGLFARFSPKIAMLVGGSVSTALEAMTEAGDVWQEAKDTGSSEYQADKRATKTFWANAVLIGITNRLGIFNTDVGQLKKFLLSAPLEGFQEFGQQIISNVVSDKQWDQGAYEAGAIGTILGGLMGTADFGTKLPTPTEIEEKKKDVMLKTGLNSENAERLIDYVNELMIGESKTKKPDIFNQAVEEARIDNGEIPQIVDQAIKDAGVNIEVTPSQLQTQQPNPSEIYSIPTKNGETIFTNNARLAKQANPDFISINTSDLNIRTFRTEQEIRDYVQSQEATTLNEAIEKEGKFDAYAIQDSKTGNIAYGVVKSDTLADTLRSKQFISNKEAEQSFQSFRFVKELKLPTQFTQRILTPQGKEAFGKYSNTITQFVNNPMASTPSHEAVHGYLDLMVGAEEKQSILDEIKRRYAGKKLDNTGAEEQLANDFIKYIRAKENNTKAKAASTKLQRLFDWMMEQFKKISGGTDKINKFYSDVISKKPSAKQRIDVAGRIRRAMADFSAVQEAYYQNPEALTTKFLEHPDVKNREKVGYQFLKNLLNSKSLPLKGAERTLIEDVLETQFKDQKNIVMEDFKNAVIGELLPLEIIESDSYSDYGMDNIERSEEDTTTYILNSPFEHGVTGHFSGDFEKRIFPEKVEIKQIPTTEKWAVIRKGVDLTEENISNNVFHVSSEKSGAEQWLKQRLSKRKADDSEDIDVSKKGLFSHFRSLDNDAEGSYITEIQSDTFQKLDKVIDRAEKYFKYFWKEEDAIKAFEDGVAVFVINQQGDDSQVESVDEIKSAFKYGEGVGIEETQPGTKDEEAFLSYKNTWHERTVREAIRIKAMEGFKQVFFPAPYTVAKIEGYLSEDGQIPEGTSVGDTFDYGGTDYTLLTNQYDESGKAVPSEAIRGTWDFDTVRDEDVNREIDDMHYSLKEISTFEKFTDEIYTVELSNNLVDRIKKEFESNKKLDDNTIDEIANEIVDARYTDTESYVDYSNDNIEEDYAFATENDQIIILNDNKNIETFSFGSTDEGKTDFDQTYEDNDNLADEHKTVLRFYDKQIHKYLKKFRKTNLELITDKNGYDWWKTEIMPEDKAAVEAFQTKEGVDPEIIEGQEVADYFKEISEEINEEADGEPGYDEYVYNLIKNGKYELRRLKIHDILDDDPDAADYVDDGTNRYDDGELDPITANNPIIIGYWADGKKGVLDGYNRLLTKLNNDYKTIDAYVAVEPKFQTINDLTDDERMALEMRRGEMMDNLMNKEISREEEILNAREYSPNFSSEKYVGYQNFKRLARRRPWMLDNATDDAKIKSKIKNINIDDTLFSGANDMTNNELLELFKSEYFYEKSQNEIAKQKTPTEVYILEKRASEKIVKNETIGRKPTIRQAINVATGNVASEKITQTEKQLIKQRLRAIIQGVKMGRADMKATMLDAFKTSYSEMQDIKKAIIEFAKPLSTNDKGKLLNLVAKARNKKDLIGAYVRIDNLLEMADRREALEQLKQTTKAVAYARRTGKNIALDYQQKIMEIMKSYSIKNPMQKTLDKLNDLKKFIEANPEIQIPKGVTDKLGLLLKTPAKDLSVEGIRELNKMISQLASLGHLKLQLKNKYDERQRQVSLEKLVSSTRNMDSVNRTYLNTIHAFRVTDIMDGSQDYRGQNTLYQKKISRKVGNAELTSNILLDAIFSQISGFKNKWTEDEQAIIELHLLLDMKANTQAQQLISSRDWQEIPKLTEEMKIAMGIMRGAFDKYVDDVAAVYEEHNNKEFQRVDNYFPLKYTKKRGEIPEPTIGQTIARGKNVEQGFTFGRQKGIKRIPRVDVFAQFEEAIREQQYYLHVQPALLEAHSLVNDGAYAEVGGEVAVNWWKDYIDAMSNKGRLSRSTHNPMLAKIRINLSRAILGYKVSSILMQPMAIFDALAYTYGRFGNVATARLLTHFAGAFIDPTYSGRVRKLSPALQLRDGGELAIEEIEGGKEIKGINKVGFIRKFQKNSLAPLKWLDLKTASAVAQSTYKTLRASGLSEEEARLESDVIMNITSGSSEIADRPMVLMGDELWRTVFTFQTFLLNRWGIIAHDLIGAGIKDGNFTRKARSIIGLMILAMGGAFEDEVRKVLYEKISGKKLAKDANFLKSALMTIPESIPILGQMLKSTFGFNQGYSIPLTRTVENIFVGMQMTTSDKEETRNKGILKMTESLSTLFGVAGTSQGFDLLERSLFDDKKTKRIQQNIDMMPGIPEINFPSIPKLPSL